MNRIIVGLVAVLILAAAAFAGEMKSDPANYYLDPEEIRPIVRDSLEEVAVLSKEWGHALKDIETLDVRLIDGQLPIYSVSGEVLAYIYIAYVLPGPLPSLDDVINSYYSEVHPALHPYENSYAYAKVGATPKVTSWEAAVGVPGFITCLPVARKGAAACFGGNAFHLVRILMWPGSVGYEFSDGYRDFIVPVNILYRIVIEESILPRAEMEREIEKYEFAIDEKKARKWAGLWEYNLRALNRGP